MEGAAGGPGFGSSRELDLEHVLVMLEGSFDIQTVMPM